jgi:hypothetical protein
MLSPEPCKYVNGLIPIPRTYFLNVIVGKDLMHKSARVLEYLTCRIFTSPSF